MDKDTILEFIRELKNNKKVKVFKKIGLFGSFTKGNEDIFSDIDIAVQVDKKYLKDHDVWDYFDAINTIKNLIWKKFGVKSDIFDIESVSPYKKNILRDIVYV